jgi:DNA-binding LacI/PurR family transcriptional regulator
MANPVATEMMQGKSIIVAGLVPSFNSVFFMDLFQIIARKLQTIGLRLHICSYASNVDFTEVLSDFAARKASGAIFVPPKNEQPEIPAAVIASMPTISLLTSLSISGIHCVHPDEEQTGFNATSQLIQRGHRRIAMVDFTHDTRPIAARAQGYHLAMQRAHLNPIRLRKPDAQTLTALITEQRITALFCHNDWLALETIRQLNSAGLRVPEDVSVMGVDDSPTFTSLCSQISTMRYPFDDIALHVAAILKGKPLKRKVIACQWIERQSVISIPS